jgi:alpha-ketoglutarate-dependent taurine dioxygenase
MVRNELDGAPQQPLIAEASVPEGLASSILASTLGLNEDIYQEDFVARGRFIGSVGDVTEALEQDTIVGPALSSLVDGSIVALSLSDFPVDPELPDAPADGGRPLDKRTFVSEGIAIAIANILGYPSIILGEKREELVHQITPVPGRETSQSNEGSDELLFHQDLAPNKDLPRMAYHETMPTWLILTGLQSGSGSTPTYIAALDEALPLMSQQAIDILRQQRFVTNPPDSFVKEAPELASRLPVHPILLDYNGHVEAAFDTSSDVRPIGGARDEEAMGAIAEFNEALGKVKHGVVIEPGTTVIFNNRRVVHGRGAVTQEQDIGQKRWLQRVYVFEPERIALQSLGNPGTTLQIGGGLVRLTNSYQNPSDRLLELAG